MFCVNGLMSILQDYRQQNLSHFWKRELTTFLRQAGTDAEVTIRVVSSSNKFLDTKIRYDHTYYLVILSLSSGIVDRFSYFPNQFPYRTKALFVFEEIDGAEVCFFWYACTGIWL